MAGGNFIARIVQYVANELIVNRLANSPGFQRFAIRTTKQLEELQKKAAEAQAEILEQARTKGETLKREVTRRVEESDRHR